MKTQNDLSFNQVKIDYDALVSSLEYGIARTRDEINRLVHKTYELQWNFTSLDAERLAKYSNHLQTLVETYQTIKGMEEREIFEFVNLTRS